ncbi:MAG: ABC transporter permease [Anaerolineae bacterium]|jgi:peptide/nickel transport system permease protein|nr:ABC transporter permease [Anaerolineae bacterium]
MIGFATIATVPGLLIGMVCGLIPLGIALYYRQLRPGLLGWLACAFSGFACGFLGGVPMIVLTTAVVISYAYVNKQDPFTSRAALAEVNFEETRLELLLRLLAGLGNSVRAGLVALLRNKAGFIGFLGVLFFFLMSVFGPLLIPYDGRPHPDRRLPESRTLFQAPSAQFPLGLDWQGRDILSHVVHGGQGLILTAGLAGVLTTIIAVVLGALAALLGGVVDQVFSAFSNFILTIPQFPLLLVLASVLTFESNVALALLFALLSWPTLMRAVRAQVLSLRERDYVEAAIALDLGLWHITLREVLPNMISYIVVNMIFSIRVAMYSIVGLVFLGMVPLREPDWGVMIFVGRQQGALSNSISVWMVLAPVLAIALFQLSLVMFTRSLEEVFNPRLRSGL